MTDEPRDGKDQNVNVCFFGAARTVTGSRHLVELPRGRRVLLDCGLYQGRRRDTYERNWNFPFDPAAVDAVILSHAHIDHSGALPNLVKRGFQGSVHCTQATADLCAVMLRDSGHVQEMDAQYASKRRAKHGEPPVEPLYTVADAEASLDYFQGHAYYETFDLFGDGSVLCTFLDAGHILGSAQVVLDIRRERKTGRRFDGAYCRLVFSGDIGRDHLPIIRDPDFPEGAHAVIMESTYGDRLHEPIEETEERLRELVARVVARGGKIIVPAFSVGRTQALVYQLHELWRKGALPRIPIFVDSPLAAEATEVFRRHPDCYDEETRALMAASETNDPFGFKTLTYVHDVEESKRLNECKDPCIIISASGMCEAGRILHHLIHNIEDPKNCILITGFMANHTLGRRLVEEQPEVRIFGETHRLQAEVVVMNAFSAHADRDGLTHWLDRVKGRSPRLRRVFLVHGEEQQALALEQRLLDQHPELFIRVPELGQCYELSEATTRRRRRVTATGPEGSN
ncbi:MAG: MBL fold metallo-hydrolase [Candidatus Sumerlaeia bacterium]